MSQGVFGEFVPAPVDRARLLDMVIAAEQQRAGLYFTLRVEEENGQPRFFLYVDGTPTSRFPLNGLAQRRENA